MFKKPKKFANRRIGLGISDENEAEDEQFTQIQVVQEKIVQKAAKTPFEKPIKKSLLSFADDEDEEESEVFQVKKSSHSKKLMKQLDKERRKKKKELGSSQNQTAGDLRASDSVSQVQNSVNSVEENKTTFTSKVQTEIRTDEFVLVVKKSEPIVTYNGKEALYIGKDEMSSEEEEPVPMGKHKFHQPDLKMALESGIIPNAAMIHAARKSRQKARELGDYIQIEERSPEEVKQGKRLVREGEEEDVSGSDDERMDMADITGKKELRQREEAFLEAQQCSSEESDGEFGAWESQQIRKGVTSLQLSNACQENILQAIQQPVASTSSETITKPQTTAELLQKAYAGIRFSKPAHSKSKSEKEESKPSSLKSPQEILEAMMQKIKETKELHAKHLTELKETAEEIERLNEVEKNCTEQKQVLAEKYKFYQETRFYFQDLQDCFDEKVAIIKALEARTLTTYAKQAKFLIERRRQDVRDQAKEIAEINKAGYQRKIDSDEQFRIKRAAEREGRRNRRRRERERDGTHESHMDGMSSDDEVNDLSAAQHNESLEEIRKETAVIFDDVVESFCNLRQIFTRLEQWKESYNITYNEAFVPLCVPRICGPIVRVQMMLWNPLLENCENLEEMPWFADCLMYAESLVEESEEFLISDTDSRLVPTLVEKVVLPKLNDLIQECWDPMSTTQTLRLIKLIGRFASTFPSVRSNSKALRTLFTTIHDKMKLAIESDVFIPLFPNQIQEAKSSFFQRQFSGGLKLFRNIISWQGILADEPLKQLAVLSLLNRYLLLAMRACSPTDATSKAAIVLYTLPRVWISTDSPVLSSFEMFVSLLRYLNAQIDPSQPHYAQAKEHLEHILKSLHVV